MTQPRHVTTALDGAEIIENNIERFYAVIHGVGQSSRRFMCTPNALREHLTNDAPNPEVRPYAQDPAFKKAFMERMKRDGFASPLCCKPSPDPSTHVTFQS